MGNGAVCVQDSTDIEIKNNLTAELKIYRTFEITSEAGTELSEISIPINDFIEIKDIKGYTLLPGGHKIELKRSDIRTASAAEVREFGGYRVVLISLRTPVPGASLHYEYTMKLKSLLYLPRIERKYPYKTQRFAVRVRWQNKVEVDYDYEGLDLDLKNRTALFTADDLGEIPNESHSCPSGLYLILSTKRFKYDKKEFRSESWQDVGEFYRSRATLSAKSGDEIRQLASELINSSDFNGDTIGTIFDFVADSVSYVSLNLGKSDFDPHSCDLILKRRFGDCKDQSFLLNAIFDEIGIKAYPVLIATNDYPSLETLHPWPSLFDHVAAAIDGPGGEIILDPSEQHYAGGFIPARLRGKYFLVADGISGLERLADGQQPANDQSWEINLDGTPSHATSALFDFSYRNDTADSYKKLYEKKTSREISGMISQVLRESGWHNPMAEVDSIISVFDSLRLVGQFIPSEEEMGLEKGLSIGSPLLLYLLENFFSESRIGDYCNSGSYRLDETIRIECPDSISAEQNEFNELWVRDRLEFSDELSHSESGLIYHRAFYFAGGKISADDYNEFRDYILSLKNQRYYILGR